MYKACIFDLDGTLADTVSAIAHFANLVLKKHNLLPYETEKYNYFAGNGAFVLTRRMLQNQDKYSKELHDIIYKEYIEEYNKIPLYKTKVFDGLKESIKALKEKGIKLAVVTNKPQSSADLVISSLFEDGTFDYVIGIEGNRKKKPDPSSVIEVLNLFKIKSEECVYVGDTDTDMQTGNNANCFTVGVLWGFRDKQELIDNGAMKIIEKPKELVEFF